VVEEAVSATVLLEPQPMTVAKAEILKLAEYPPQQILVLVGQGRVTTAPITI
jgi:hypothetical protein